MGKRKHSGSGKPGATEGKDAGFVFPQLSQKDPWSLVTKQLVQDRLITIQGVLGSAECTQLINAAEQHTFKHQGSRGAAHGEAYRDNHRIALQDCQFACQLWERCGLSAVAEALKFDGCAAVGLNPNIRIYRYSGGQRFGRHVDGSNTLQDGRVTGYTLLIYLNGNGQRKGKGGTKAPAGSGLLGGETVFYDDRGAVLRSVAPLEGMALLHLHGEECYEHEGAVVEAGTKYVLRSDVVFG